MGVSVVNTFEGSKREWTTVDEDMVFIRYSLNTILRDAARVTATAVGYACGDGVVDWERGISICRVCWRTADHRRCAMLRIFIDSYPEPG